MLRRNVVGFATPAPVDCSLRSGSEFLREGVSPVRHIGITYPKPSPSRPRGPSYIRPQPSRKAVSVVNMSVPSAPGQDNNALLIVGAGVLGKCIAAQWLSRHPGAVVVGETRSDTSHEQLSAAGIVPAIVGSGETHIDGGQFSRIVFCAPPSGSKDYPGDVRDAVSRVAPGGIFVFTSSGGVYQGGNEITEDAPVGDSERTLKLLNAERVTLDAPEGRVVRLAGLYNTGRGPQGYYLKASGVLPGSSKALVNLVHYEDAASMTIACLELSENIDRRVFLAADCSPISREDICSAALAHPQFAGCSMPEFENAEAPSSSKTYDNTASRTALEWTPQYPSFGSFMLEDAKLAKESQASPA